MPSDLKIEAFALPRAAPGGGPAVHVTVMHGFAAHHVRLTLDEAIYAHSRLGHAIGALQLGAAYSAGTDPRDQERIYRAKLAVRLGLAADDVCAVFDLTHDAHAAIVAEVAR